MATFPHTVVEFTQPAFVGGAIPHMVINGQAITQQGLKIKWNLEPELFEMTTLSGLSIPHHSPESPLAPTTTNRIEVSGTAIQPSENTRNALDLAASLTRAALLSIWFDHPAIEIWLSNGSTTVLVTSRPFPWATLAPHGVTVFNRPVRAYLTNMAAANELTVIYSGAPAAGEVLINGTTDGTAIILGAAPAAGTPIIVQAYWLRRGSFNTDHDRAVLAEYEIDFEFREFVPERSFE